MFCDIRSPYCPTGFGYPRNTTLGKIEHVISYSIENDLVVLTKEDCESLYCAPPNEWRFLNPTLVDLWTILVKTGKVNPHWNTGLTKLALYTLAKLRDPSISDVYPSFDKRIGPFLSHPALSPHNLLTSTLILLCVLLKRKRYPEPVEQKTYKHIICEFLDHPSFKPCLLLADSHLSQNLYNMPTTYDQTRNTLVAILLSELKSRRQAEKTTLKQRANIFKEELVAKAFHPTRVERWLNEGGFDLIEMMF